MNIWARYRGNVERIDECSARDAAYLVREYQLAYGSEWVVWAGRKSDEPGRDR